MSTFGPDPVVLVASCAALLMMLRARPGNVHPQPAMPRARLGRGRANTMLLAAAWCSVAVDHGAVSNAGGARGRSLTRAAFGLRPPSAAEYGAAARIHPLRRVRSAVLLGVLLVLLGVLVALSLGIVVFLAGFLLEQAIT